MSESTKIQWCDSTVNFWRGCDKVSPGCKNCYITTTIPFRMSGQKHGDPRVLSEGAFKMAHALNRKSAICPLCGESGNGEFVQTHRHGSVIPSFRRRRIFSLSLGDWLDPEVPIEWLARMLDTIRQCDQVTWILCTKRPELFSKRILQVSDWIEDEARPRVNWFPGELFEWIEEWAGGSPPKNVWLLASVENQEMADKRIPELLRIPAVVRGLSLEPLLGAVDLNTSEKSGPMAPVDWLIVGGESGDGARRCSMDWIRSIVAQGKRAGVATFVKQLGANAWLDGNPHQIVFHHKKGGDPAEWPEDLRVQEFPGA